MKIATIILLITSSMVSASVYSQNTKLTLKYSNISFYDLFQKIEEQSEFRFAFSGSKLNSEQKVQINITNGTLEQILSKTLPLNVGYEIVDRYVIITDQHDLESKVSKALQNQISGTITDDAGKPIPGVTIMIKDSNTGTISDSEGKYILADLPADAVLVFSFIGMKTQEIPVAGQSQINVTLLEEFFGIDEVVAVGYGTMKKSDITGAVASVDAEELEKLPLTRLDQALQGRTSGVVIQNNNASPNGTVTIRIRGNNSINGGNSPLIVVDGIIGESINVNPNDVESVEVLKDASATAVYGSRGANGVILITTKHGKTGATRIAYNSFVSLQQIRKKIDLMNAADYATTVNDHRASVGMAEVFTAAEIEALRADGGTDWQDELYRDALWQNHQVSVSGGNDNVSYYISGNVEDRDGIIINSALRKYSLRGNLDAKIGKKAKVGVNMYMFKTDDHPVRINGRGDGNTQNPTYAVQQFAPVLPVYDENGLYTQPAGTFGPPNTYNPVALALEPIYDNFSLGYTGNAFLEYEIIEGLTIKVSGAYRVRDYENNQYINSKPTYDTGSEYAEINTIRTFWAQNTNQINYAKEFTSGHKFSITAVLEQQYEEGFSSEISGQGFSIDAIKYNNIGLADNVFLPSSSRSSKSILSYVGRLNYSFKDKYLFTFTGRYDGASVFGEDNKWGFFPSAAVGWHLHNEPFMEAIDQISYLKLRGSYGITGSQALGAYASLASLSTSKSYAIDGTNLLGAVTMGSLANPDLRWEKTTQQNIGIDLKMFNNRFEFTSDFYIKRTSDLLISSPVPLTSGFSTIIKNIGEVENRGVEFYFGGFPVSQEFVWETGFNISVNKNKVLKLLDDNEPISLGSPGSIPGFGNTIWLEVGQPLGLFKGYLTDGIWGTDEAAEAASYGTIPGGTKYVDVTPDGVIDTEDITIMGNAQPKFVYGWNNSFSYKNLDLNVFIQGVQGNKIYNINRVRIETSTTDADATSSVVLDRWTADNQDTDVPSFDAYNYNELQQSDRWLEDGSYLRVKNITLGYTLPASILNKVRISSARIYLSGTNLITLTKYTGYEPEASTSVDERAGVDLSTYPSQKIYTLGLNINF